MRILFDQGTPVPLRKFLHLREVHTAAELGWAELENGDLLSAAEEGGFDLMITTDQNLRYQQNLEERQIGILVLMSASWPKIREKTEKVIISIEDLPAGGYVEVTI